ncbi:MarR family winged helix-turn-helix transcriptional regulator [Aeromicrobium ginsengisoli]|uniref:MarR family transcriptional regulator n=1 Tax=Aeromicrobium ginsengisoli TaxID=363867 RepID=A0A5M4FB23_9ACTN|nr:MarR family transcriptional regulator [Aeromicrobium ginsengisoli]KAA1395541.1 MarR family transcriptional regulator [Aeromicrobium ginsengisoli]
MDDTNPLALEEQVCFALAVASRSVIASYRTVLEPLGLTHPQYLTMLALWEHGTLSVKALGELLHLEPATVSPLVKRLEQAELVTRTRSSTDERQIEVALTATGRALRRNALKVPTTMLARFGMTVDDLRATNAVLHRIIDAAEAVPA